MGLTAFLMVPKGPKTSSKFAAAIPVPSSLTLNMASWLHSQVVESKILSVSGRNSEFCRDLLLTLYVSY